MDTTVNACDNFFRYAVGGWLKGNQIPAAFSSWGVDQIVEKYNFDILKNVLEKAAADKTAAKGSSTQMIGDFYSSCMDEAAINAAGTDPIKPYLAEIDNIKTPTDVIKVTADLQKDGFGVMFNFFANADQKKSTINIANSTRADSACQIAITTQIQTTNRKRSAISSLHTLQECLFC